MYSTEIKIGERVIPIRFGAYVMKLIADGGTKLQDLEQEMSDNPFDLLPKIIYYGAVNASPGRKGEGLDLNDIYDWLDEVEGGLLGEEASKLLLLFTNQMTDGVPKNLEAQTTTNLTTKE